MASAMVNPKNLRFIGSGLHRPECLLALTNGSIHVAEHRRGVSIIDVNGAGKDYIRCLRVSARAHSRRQRPQAY